MSEEIMFYVMQGVITLTAAVAGIKMGLNGLKDTVNAIDRKTDIIGDRQHEHGERLATLEERSRVVSGLQVQRNQNQDR